MSIIKKILFICVVATSFSAHATLEEIVVTGARLERYSSDLVPQITLNKRPDYVLANYDFVCDTRDYQKRKKELSDTIEDLINKAGKRSDIELSTLVEYEDGYDTLYFPVPFTKLDDELFDAQYGRSDTSLMQIIIKTPVNGSIETINDALEVIEGFVESVEMSGRTEAVETDDAQLSIVNVSRYREELIGEILKDAQWQKQLVKGSRFEISGLEQTVRWERVGELALKIYIPYVVKIEINQ